jgi:hypothetical protein
MGRVCRCVVTNCSACRAVELAQTCSERTEKASFFERNHSVPVGSRDPRRRLRPARWFRLAYDLILAPKRAIMTVKSRAIAAARDAQAFEREQLMPE